MNIILVLLALTFPPASPSDGSFAVQSQLQGRYDEISQTTLQFLTPADVDNFHQVMYTPDWVFVDAKGGKQGWTELRPQAIQALSMPRPTSMLQRIKKVKVDPDGARTEVTLTMRTVVDIEGRHGQPGASHTIEETTVFRDQWIQTGGDWKMKSREQVGEPKVVMDPPTSLHPPRAIVGLP